MNTVLLEFEEVSLMYPILDRPILDHVNYTVNKGDFVIVLGANGSGKSSLLKLLDGRYRPSDGSILLANQDLIRFSAKKRARYIHTLTQHAKDSLFLYLTVFENYQLHASKNRSLTALSDYFADFNPNLSQKLDVLVGDLSGGEQQALALALAVLDPPEILLLDEHTSALDPKTAEHLMALTARVIRERHITAMLTTHNVEHALRYGDRILALKEGEVYDMIEKADKLGLTADAVISRCY